MMRRIFLGLITACFLAVFPGAVRADLDRGINAYLDGDYRLAVIELRPLAEAGDIIAQYYLGEMHLRGRGVEQDFEKATALYEQAAQFGHPQSQAALGALQILGLGVPRYPGGGYFWLILSVVWSESELRGEAMASLGEVAGQLSPEQKQAIGAHAARQWRRSGQQVPRGP